jgi:uncharacterized protein
MHIDLISGSRVSLVAPHGPVPSIEVIARALSQINRFAGNTSVFYSVADHCLNVAEWAPQRYKLEALMHDAHEAIIGDIPTPVKQYVLSLGGGAALFSLERSLQGWIADHYRFNFESEIAEHVEFGDRVLLHTEMLQFRGFIPPECDVVKYPPLVRRINPRTPDEAYRDFMAEFARLYSLRIIAEDL